MRGQSMQYDRYRVARMYRLEKAAIRLGYRVVCGIDEAGRGALAGPVVAGAVVLKSGTYVPMLKDSKLLTRKNRELVFREIKKRALAIGVGIISNRDIDSLNILKATKYAMKEALSDLNMVPDLLILDAITLEDVDIPARVMVRADRKSASVAAGSVVAKVIRDRIMEDLDIVHQGYGFRQNKGYGTRSHIKALGEQGPTTVHRVTFAPVTQVCNQLTIEKE
ncbi:MAG: ribonuclease HII [bacterium]|nr:ribonuclease HII [bacterium]